METPFVVDADGFIMYVDEVPNLWHEVEGHGTDVFEENVVEPSESEDADMYDRISVKPKKLEAEVPSRVHRIKHRRDQQIIYSIGFM